MQRVISAVDSLTWHDALAPLEPLDPTYLPEYHQAYSLRIAGSQPLLWHYEENGHSLIYPFLLTPVIVNNTPTRYFDISGIYGYTGPIATTDAPEFLASAWRAFDAYAAQQKIIAEFIRFSPYNRNERFAHSQMRVEANRNLAVSHLPKTEEGLLTALGSKTRNMLRKAEQAGLVARELALPEHLNAFRQLYDDTMTRNQAPSFFLYDDAYWNRLLLLGKDGLRLFGVFAGDMLVAAAMAVVHGKSALYHLGASLYEYSKHGAGNLSLYEMSRALMHSGVEFINMTGGRTTAADDPLLLFKKSNATGTATFYIGKRILNANAYAECKALHGREPDAAKIIFWR